jgi:hypothetical protein
MSVYLHLLKQYGKATADRYLVVQQGKPCIRAPRIKRHKPEPCTIYLDRHPDPQQQEAIEQECRALLEEYERRRNKAYNKGRRNA